MHTVLFMAMSLNGIIARENGEEDFLSHYGWECFVKIAKEYGNFIVGRKTYELTKKYYEGFGFDDLKGIKKIIVSRNKDVSIGSDYQLVSSPEEALFVLANESFETALLTGGSELNSSFMQKKLIQEVIINVEPVIVGNGIPVIGKNSLDLRLELRSCDRYDRSGLTFRYSVLD